jgi:hypothetical protein
VDINTTIVKNQLNEALIRAESRTLQYVAEGKDYAEARYLRGVAHGLELAHNLIQEMEKSNDQNF